MSKKEWQLSGNIVVGIAILIMGIANFYVFPSTTLHDIDPYAGTMAAGMKVLIYAPYWIPAVVALLTIGSYYRFRRNLQQTFLSLGVILAGVSLSSSFAYGLMEEGFLNRHIVYEGRCTAIAVGIHTNGYDKSLYANFTCDNDPTHVVKVWDVDIIANLANHPNARSAVYQLSAGDTLSLPPQTH